MTTYNKATLKTFFEQGDIPSGSDYANLIDSQINIVETGVQVMGGALNPTELITARVSATDVNVTGTFRVAGITSAGTMYVDNLMAGNALVTLNALNVTGTTSADRLYANSAVVSAMTMNAASINTATYTSFVKYGVGVVSAAGTTQGAAAVLINTVNRGKGIADGTTTGFTPPANNAGLVQYLFNEGVSANLWPPVGGTINGLAANTAFPLVASAMVTIVHLTASAMAVK